MADDQAGGDPDSEPGPDPEPVHESDQFRPTIRSFTVRAAGGAPARQLNLPGPQRVTFEWDVPTAGVSLAIDPFGPVSGNSHAHYIANNDNTNYVLIAKGSGGEQAASVKITVAADQRVKTDPGREVSIAPETADHQQLTQSPDPSLWSQLADSLRNTGLLNSLQFPDPTEVRPVYFLGRVQGRAASDPAGVLTVTKGEILTLSWSVKPPVANPGMPMWFSIPEYSMGEVLRDAQGQVAVGTDGIAVGMAVYTLFLYGQSESGKQALLTVPVQFVENDPAKGESDIIHFGVKAGGELAAEFEVTINAIPGLKIKLAAEVSLGVALEGEPEEKKKNLLTEVAEALEHKEKFKAKFFEWSDAKPGEGMEIKGPGKGVNQHGHGETELFSISVTKEIQTSDHTLLTLEGTLIKVGMEGENHVGIHGPGGKAEWSTSLTLAELEIEDELYQQKLGAEVKLALVCEVEPDWARLCEMAVAELGMGVLLTVGYVAEGALIIYMSYEVVMKLGEWAELKDGIAGFSPSFCESYLLALELPAGASNSKTDANDYRAQASARGFTAGAAKKAEVMNGALARCDDAEATWSQWWSANKEAVRQAVAGIAAAAADKFKVEVWNDYGARNLDAGIYCHRVERMAGWGRIFPHGPSSGDVELWQKYCDPNCKSCGKGTGWWQGNP